MFLNDPLQRSVCCLKTPVTNSTFLVKYFYSFLLIRDMNNMIERIFDVNHRSIHYFLVKVETDSLFFASVFCQPLQAWKEGDKGLVKRGPGVVDWRLTAFKGSL